MERRDTFMPQAIPVIDEGPDAADDEERSVYSYAASPSFAYAASASGDDRSQTSLRRMGSEHLLDAGGASSSSRRPSDSDDDDGAAAAAATAMELALAAGAAPGAPGAVAGAEAGSDLRGSFTSQSTTNTFSYIGAVDASAEAMAGAPPQSHPTTESELRGSLASQSTYYSYIGAVDASSSSVAPAPGDSAAARALSPIQPAPPPPTPSAAAAATARSSLVDVPLAGGAQPPPSSDLTSFLDQAVYALEEEEVAAAETRSREEGSFRDDASSVVSAASSSRAAAASAAVADTNATGGGGEDDNRSQASLPSYGFRPAVAETSRRILRSYRPKTRPSSALGGGHRRLGGLLAWRRGRRRDNASSSSSSSAAAGGGPLASVGEDDGHPEATPLKTNKGHASVAGTEVTEEEDDGGEQGGGTVVNPAARDDGSGGSPLKDTYSFIYVYAACPPSAPFVYAILLFLFQGLVYALLLRSLIDVDHPVNPLHVPPNVSVEMRVAQACAILIAVFNSVDIMVALNNLLRAPDAIVVHNPDAELSPVLRGVARDRCGEGGCRHSFPAGARFKFANVLRLIEGCLGLTASFILIVRSDDVIDMFINFAALEFVVNLDNLAFALAEHGLISNHLQHATRFVCGLGFHYDGREVKGNRAPRRLLPRVVGWPVRFLRQRPDATRRSTLFIMTLTLFGCWGYILAGLNKGDYLCKLLDVEFFHAHVPAASAEEADEGVKSYLSTRSGTYLATFAEQENSFADTLLNLFTGKSPLFVAYRKVDLKLAETRETRAVNGRLPIDYVEVVFYDPLVKQWVFTTCDPDTDLSRPDRECLGPQVHSDETDTMDLTALSTSPFHIGEDEDPDAPFMVLPASVSCNECGLLRNSDLRSVGSNVRTCGLTGGECSAPREDLGFSRQCVCPPGQYGLYCGDHYGQICPTLEVVRERDETEPWEPGGFERRPFRLVRDERGVGNTPVWERRLPRYAERMEWRGGSHWIVTRRMTETDVVLTVPAVHAVAIADDAGTSKANGVSPGLLGGPHAATAATMVQPPPAGLTFYAPRAGAWGTQPDYPRPYSSYGFRCVATPTRR